MQQLDYSEIGKRIRQVRKAKKWSQGALAEKCGISMSFLGHIERGTRIMSMDTFISWSLIHKLKQIISDSLCSAGTQTKWNMIQSALNPRRCPAGVVAAGSVSGL